MFPKIEDEINLLCRPLLFCGIFTAIAAWLLPLINYFIGSDRAQHSELIVWLFLWPIVYSFCIIVLIHIRRMLHVCCEKGESPKALIKFATPRQFRVLDIMYQICCLLGLPLTALFAMVFG